ncbi:MAG: radical SAM family heme chaperone HemW [Lachnospiraceae bacterium]|nr:radical SAM family heme chaperone HemW [Lachnospiraceae bacterium]
MRDLSIYIHIPFCVRKCLYCDFLSGPVCGGEMESYVNLLLREIKKQAEFYGDHRVISIFLGGGTPSLLPAWETGRILERIREEFSLTEDAEITVECNPGTVTAEKLKNYITYGINRLSIGLQSTDDGELARIGRIHDYGSFLETYRLAREAGFRNVNIDLMAGLPGQSLASYRKTLERVVALSPEHISAYSLILEEGTPLYVNQEAYTFPDEEEEREMYELTGRCLGEAGFYRYEISNYAREGRECRHNKVYWRRGDYAGFGLGASSMVRNVRWKNPDGQADYAACVEKMEADALNRVAGITETETGRTARMKKISPQGMDFEEMLRQTGRCEVQILTTQEQMEEFMFLGLRLTEGVDLQEFQRYFGKTAEEVYGEQISSFEKQGLLKREGRRLRLTPRGIDVSNVVFSAFLF